MEETPEMKSNLLTMLFIYTRSSFPLPNTTTKCFVTSINITYNCWEVTKEQVVNEASQLNQNAEFDAVLLKKTTISD